MELPSTFLNLLPQMLVKLMPTLTKDENKVDFFFNGKAWLENLTSRIGGYLIRITRKD